MYPLREYPTVHPDCLGGGNGGGGVQQNRLELYRQFNIPEKIYLQNCLLDNVLKLTSSFIVLPRSSATIWAVSCLACRIKESPEN